MANPRNRKINELPEKNNGNLSLQDRFPLVDSNGIAHNTSLQTLKDLLNTGNTGAVNFGVQVVSDQDISLQNSSAFAILVDATNHVVTCTLPTPSLGKHYVFKKIDSSDNNVIIKTYAGQVAPRITDPGFPAPLIDNSSTQTLFQQYESLTLISDGNNWFIL